MFKIILLLSFPYILFANCNYALDLDLKFDISQSDIRVAKKVVEKEMLKKNYIIVDKSNLTLDLSSRLEFARSRYNIETVLELRIDGSLESYSYGEGDVYRSLNKAKSLKNIKSSLKNVIRNLSSCSDD